MLNTIWEQDGRGEQCRLLKGASAWQNSRDGLGLPTSYVLNPFCRFQRLRIDCLSILKVYSCGQAVEESHSRTKEVGQRRMRVGQAG